MCKGCKGLRIRMAAWGGSGIAAFYDSCRTTVASCDRRATAPAVEGAVHPALSRGFRGETSTGTAFANRSVGMVSGVPPRHFSHRVSISLADAVLNLRGRCSRAPPPSSSPDCRILIRPGAAGVRFRPERAMLIVLRHLRDHLSFQTIHNETPRRLRPHEGGRTNRPDVSPMEETRRCLCRTR